MKLIFSFRKGVWGLAPRSQSKISSNETHISIKILAQNLIAPPPDLVQNLIAPPEKLVQKLMAPPEKCQAPPYP